MYPRRKTTEILKTRGTMAEAEDISMMRMFESVFVGRVQYE